MPQSERLQTLGEFLRERKVRHLDVPVGGYEHVLRFQVSVDCLAIVQVLEHQHGPGVKFGVRFEEATVSVHVREKLAAEHLIHEHEDGRVADVRLAKVDEEGRVALLHVSFSLQADRPPAAFPCRFPSTRASHRRVTGVCVEGSYAQNPTVLRSSSLAVTGLLCATMPFFMYISSALLENISQLAQMLLKRSPVMMNAVAQFGTHGGGAPIRMDQSEFAKVRLWPEFTQQSWLFVVVERSPSTTSCLIRYVRSVSLPP